MQRARLRTRRSAFVLTSSSLELTENEPMLAECALSMANISAFASTSPSRGSLWRTLSACSVNECRRPPAEASGLTPWELLLFSSFSVLSKLFLCSGLPNSPVTLNSATLNVGHERLFGGTLRSLLACP
eukprot:1404527-Rhodomonas_salina.2